MTNMLKGNWKDNIELQEQLLLNMSSTEIASTGLQPDAVINKITYQFINLYC